MKGMMRGSSSRFKRPGEGGVSIILRGLCDAEMCG